MGGSSRHEGAEVVSGVLTNLAAATAAMVAGPEIGVAAAGAAPIASVALQRAFRSWTEQRYARVKGTLDEGSSRLDITADELIQRLADDPASLDLLIAALDAASRSRLSQKITVLGGILANAVDSGGDAHTIDREHVMIGIFRDLELPHVAVLRFLSSDPEQPGHLRVARRADIDRMPEAAPVDHTLAVLRRHALVREVTTDELATWGDARQVMARAGVSQGGHGPDHVCWMITSLGSRCLQRLETEASNAASREA